MKRCPECRRDYSDETLNYCLDDGTALLEGPASGGEPATAVFGVPISLIWMKVDPVFDVFRSEPKFQEIYNRVGLPK